jgi:hypothetical protein
MGRGRRGEAETEEENQPEDHGQLLVERTRGRESKTTLLS